MLVSHRKQFIYLKTVKTASTSVESFFEPYCMPDGSWQFEKFRDETVSADGIVGYRGVNQRRWMGLRLRRWYDHMPAKRVRRQLPRKTWDSYFKFCVIRNPFDRIVSAFHFFQWMEQRGFHKMRVEQDEDEITRFRKWVAVAIEENTAVFDRGCYTIDGEICVDFFIRFENLKQDLTDVCRRLQIDADPDSLKTMVSGTRPTSIPLTAYYDGPTRSFVEDVYAFELETFGYSWPV